MYLVLKYNIIILFFTLFSYYFHFTFNFILFSIISYLKFYSDFMTLHSIIMALIEAGAHMDIVNSNGKTPYDAVTTGLFK